jgi:sec-independent protein translocase protein TatC
MPQSDSDKRMGFFDHFDELRVRLMRMLWVFMIGFIVGYLVSEPVMEWLKAPLFAVMPADRQALYFTSLFENFLTHLKIAGYSSIFLLSPYFFYEIWGFVSPGLKEREKKLVIPFISAGTFFFVGGALFAYYVLFPVGFKFFITYGSATDVPMLTIDSYYSTVLKLMLLFGLGFELPVFICLLGALGIVDSKFLREYRKQAIIGITVVSALFAPPDAVSMLILMAPLILLYEASIWVVHWIGAKRQLSEAAQAEAEEQKNSLVGKSDY